MLPNMVFDLDGTIVYNRKATLVAYIKAGVKQFPKDWYYTNGWATEEQRKTKNLIYPRALREHGRILPAGRLLLQTGGIVLSGCSPESLATFFKVFPEFIKGGGTWITRCSQEDKLSRLRLLGGGIYFDDHADTLTKVREMPGWLTIDASQL